MEGENGVSARANPMRVCVTDATGVVRARYGIRDVNKLRVNLEACNNLAFHQSTQDFRMGYVAALWDLLHGGRIFTEPLQTVEAAYVREDSRYGKSDTQLEILRTSMEIGKALGGRDGEDRAGD